MNFTKLMSATSGSHDEHEIPSRAFAKHSIQGHELGSLWRDSTGPAAASELGSVIAFSDNAANSYMGHSASHAEQKAEPGQLIGCKDRKTIPSQAAGPYLGTFCTITSQLPAPLPLPALQPCAVYPILEVEIPPSPSSPAQHSWSIASSLRNGSGSGPGFGRGLPSPCCLPAGVELHKRLGSGGHGTVYLGGCVQAYEQAYCLELSWVSSSF